MTIKGAELWHGSTLIKEVSLPVYVEVEGKWQPALDVCSHLKPLIPSKAKISVILSNHFIRSDLFAWPRGIYSEKDLNALAGLHMDQLYPHLHSKWRSIAGFQGLNNSVLAISTEKKLLDGILMVFGKQVTSIKPWFIEVLNHLKQNTANIYLIEEDLCYFAGIENRICFDIVKSPVMSLADELEDISKSNNAMVAVRGHTMEEGWIQSTWPNLKVLSLKEGGFTHV